MNISIDFGTSYTKIVYPDKNGVPALFLQPDDEISTNGMLSKANIPTEIRYLPHEGGDFRFIGTDAFQPTSYIGGTDFYGNFKFLLPLDPPGLSESGWNGRRAPAEVARDYFDQLLIRGRQSFTSQIGKIDQMLLSIPEVWYRDSSNSGSDRLVEVFHGLGFDPKNLRLQSEPVCAAAHYVYCLQKEKTGGNEHYNLLVCDMGGSSFDMTLCEIRPNSIRVLIHEGSGNQGTKLIGATFDRACVEAGCLAGVGKIPENRKDLDRLLRAFEGNKINPKIDNPHDLITEENVNTPLADTPIYFFDCYQVTICQAWNAFLPVREEILKVLKRVQDNSGLNGWKIDRLIVVGGFGQFKPVQKAISDSLRDLNVDTKVPPLFETHSNTAVVRGAFNILNGDVIVTEPYRHTIGIIVNGLVNGDLCEMEIPVILADKVTPGMISRNYATFPNGDRITIEVAGKRDEPWPIYICRNGHGPRSMGIFPENYKWPPAGEYYVAFLIDRFNHPSLILEEVQDQATTFSYQVDEPQWKDSPGKIRMTERLIEKIVQLLTQTQEPEWKRSAKALSLTYEWNQSALQAAQASRNTLLLALNEIVSALVQGDKLTKGLENLVDKAFAGPTLHEAVALQRAILAKRSTEMKKLQNQLAELERLEKEYHNLSLEQEQLTVRKKELERLETFDPGVVGTLKKQIETLEKAKPWLVEIDALKAQFAKELPRLEQLTGEAFLVITEENRRELNKAQENLNSIQKEADQQTQMLDEMNQNLEIVKADITARQKRYENAENELKKRKKILDQYIQADREIATAIDSPDAQEARQILDDIESRLHSVDDALRVAIQANEKALLIQKIRM